MLYEFYVKQSNRILIMSDLPIHIENEHDSSRFDIELDLETIDDIVSDDIALRAEIAERLENFNAGLECVYALEDYHTAIYNRDTLTNSDIKQLNIITNAIRTNLSYDYNGYTIAQEDIAELVKTGASSLANGISKTASATVNGVIKATELSKKVVEKINQGIINLASEYEIIAKLVEKRWFGIKNLIEVYNLQTAKLEDRLLDATSNSDTPRADIKVKLNTAKMDSNRKITTKEQFLKIIREDITAIVEFLDTYTKSVEITDRMSGDTLKSVAFLKPYKQTMIKNLNLFNIDVLNKLANTTLFKDAITAGNEKHSRVLIGGKRVIVSHISERADVSMPRNDLRGMIRQMNIEGSRVKGSDNVNVEIITLHDFSLDDGKELIGLLRSANEALERYNGSSIPKSLSDRNFFSRVTETITGLATAATGFVIIKNFLSNSDNLALVKQSLPVRLLNVVDMVLKAASLSTLIGLIGAKTVGMLVDWIRKFIISSLFTSMDLQYRITKIMNSVDSSVVDTLMSVRGQCYRVSEKLTKHKAWT